MALVATRLHPRPQSTSCLYPPQSCLLAVACRQWHLLLPMRLLRHGIFPAPFRKAAQPWYLQAPVHAALQCKLQLSEVSRCLWMRGEVQWGWPVPKLCFPSPRSSSCSCDSLWKLEPGNWAHEFPVSVFVFNGKLLSLEQNAFVEIGMICLHCLELSDTEMSSPLSVQTEALIRWEVGPTLLDASWRGWIFSGGVNFFHSLWAESMEIIEADYLIGSA